MKRTSLVFQKDVVAWIEKDPCIATQGDLEDAFKVYSRFIMIVNGASFVEKMEQLVPPEWLEIPFGSMSKFKTILTDSFLSSVCKRTTRLVAEVGVSKTTGSRNNIFLILTFCPSGRAPFLSKFRIQFGPGGGVLYVRSVS